MRPEREYLPATGSAQTDLVLLHGWGSNREVWRPLLAALRPWANITLVDLPGCAPGVRAPPDPVELDVVLAAVVECAPPVAVYVGWSLGGQLAVELAARHPQRVQSVVTICSNPRFIARDDWPGMPGGDFDAFHQGVKISAESALRRFDSLQTAGSSKPRIMRRRLRQQRQLPAGAELLAGLSWLRDLDQRRLLSTLVTPQLHLLGECDALVPATLAQSLAGLLADNAAARVVVLDAASHVAPLEVPELLATEMQAQLTADGFSDRGAEPESRVSKADVADSFSRAASSYDSVATLQRAVGEKLLCSLDQANNAPDTLLDLGCGTGYFSPQLRRRFPRARYIGLDLAPGMVEYARQRCPAEGEWLVGDAEALPLASRSIDLVFSSLAIQWCYRPGHLFAELARVLRPGGRCVFTSLGPQTLHELRSAWADVDTHQHVNTFLPQSDLEHAARQVPGIRLRLEGEIYSMQYQRVRELLDELKTLGAHNMNRDRPAGLTGRRALQGMLRAYESWRSDGVLPATYDVLFGVLEKPL